MADEIEVLLAEREIRRVIDTYARGVDRLDFDLVRNCYWPDATDDHGPYRGDVEGFIEYLGVGLSDFESTMHIMGHSLIDADLSAGVARAETYAVATHRLPQPDGPAIDWVCGLRYVDRFERRDGRWLIARRVCAYEWARTDPVVGRPGFGRHFVRGSRDAHDIVWHIMDPDTQ
jgi:hypothetical protein